MIHQWIYSHSCQFNSSLSIVVRLIAKKKKIKKKEREDFEKLYEKCGESLEEYFARNRTERTLVVSRA